MITLDKLKLLAEYFYFPIEEIQSFFIRNRENDPKVVHFLFLYEKRLENNPFIEYCLLTKNGRFIRLLDHINSSVDIREAARYIDSVVPQDEELEIVWDGQLSNKQYYLILDYCPPLYCGSNCN
jgi:hypothetical protein